LKENKKLTELIIFYQQKELHRTALNLLKSISKDESTPLFGIKPTIDYLKKIKDKNLILEFAKWVIFENPKEGLDIFIREKDENIEFEYSEILSFIEEMTKDSGVEPSESILLKISFLEKIVENSTNSDVHNYLILFYSQFLKFENLNANVKKTTQEKLKKFLMESKHYNPGKLLSTFLGKEGMWEERAILLSRVNSHSQALEIYVYRLKKLNLAEKYCEDHYNENDDQSKDVFLTLLDMILNPPSSTQQSSNDSEFRENSLRDSIRILEKYSDKIDPLKVLELLPNHIPLKSLNSYYSLVFRNQNQKRREIQILKNLTKIENLQIKEENVKETSKYVLIKPNKICPICHKNIGTRVFHWYPNGTICHMMCSKDLNVCPVTGTQFLKEENLKHGQFTQ
jgi:Vam6/Vps39-like protein vacuolar protein sorting-associated protein 39